MGQDSALMSSSERVRLRAFQEAYRTTGILVCTMHLLREKGLSEWKEESRRKAHPGSPPRVSKPKRVLL